MLQRIAASSLAITSMFFSPQVLAKHSAKELACEPLKKACLDAGFKSGEAAKKNGLYKDCINTSLGGKKPAKVHLKLMDLEACKKLSK